MAKLVEQPVVRLKYDSKRSFTRKSRLTAPIDSPELRDELMDTLERAFADNQSSWELHADGIVCETPHVG